MSSAACQSRYLDNNNVSVSSMAALASMLLAAKDSHIGATSTASGADKDKSCCNPTCVLAEGESNSPNSTTFLSLTGQNLNQTMLITPQLEATNSQPCPPTRIENIDDRVTKSGIASKEPSAVSSHESVERGAFLTDPQVYDAWVRNGLYGEKKVVSEDEINDESDSDSLPLNSPRRRAPVHSAAKLHDDNNLPLIVEVSQSLGGDKRTAPQQQFGIVGPDPESVPKITDKPQDSDVTLDERVLVEQRRRDPHGIYYPVPSRNNENVRLDGGEWRIANQRVVGSFPGEYDNYERNSHLESFLPVPGDVMILQRPRRPFLESYLGANPGGNTTIFVDRNYFERDQNAREEIEFQMQRFFNHNDMIVRFGKFMPGWLWRPQSTIDFFIFKRPDQRVPGKWYMHDRLPNQIKLAPPDFFFPQVMVMYRPVPLPPNIQAFIPRVTDIVIRPSANLVAQLTHDTFKTFGFVDEDLILRVSIMKSRNTYRIFTADLYMMETGLPAVLPVPSSTHSPPYIHWAWIFRGRDVQMFGPPQRDPRTGLDTILDLNGIEPFVRRPIPHWGLFEAVWGRRPDPNEYP